MEESSELLGRLASKLESEADDLVWATWSCGEGLFPSWMREPPVEQHIFDLTREAILTELGFLKNGTAPPEDLPLADLAGARSLAQTATPIASLLGSYRASQQALWNRSAELIDDEDIPAALATRLRRIASDFFFDYAARLSAMAAEAYAAERDRSLRSADRRVVNAICAVLDGEDAAAQRIEHPVGGHNIALLGAGEGTAQRLTEVARRLDCRLLLLDVLPEPWWAWLGRSRAFQLGTLEALLDLDLPAGCLLGVGTAAAGVEGFRTSHGQAAAAFHAAGEDRPNVGYREIAAEALASRDPEAARSFVAAELGAINAEDRRSRDLRVTLTTYFAHGDNARATAGALNIHQQTVGQRLEAIEKLTGSPVRSRRVELDLALRLRSYIEKRAPGEAGGEGT